MRSFLLITALLVLVQNTLHGQDTAKPRAGRAYPPQMSGSRVETYKTVGDTKLNLYVFSPQAPKNAPAIVFFFGGGWKSGSPQQFETQCRELAQRGMVAITADYRVESRHGVKPTQCLADARSAVRWVRAHEIGRASCRERVYSSV